MFKGKTLLITGGTGSFGNAVLDRFLNSDIKEIRVFSRDELTESVKWNGPNYSINGEDRITIRISPKKQLQVIFHRGAKVKEMPKNRLLSGDYDILIWKENDRAIASFNTMNEIQEKRQMIIEVVGKWIEATT
jgi:NAD(P)-dependent dehydrogenase (short-subunit alcohol dehydrogenase family)